MELMQRLGNDFSDEYIENYIKYSSKYPRACDNVWLPTLYGYPTKETHAKTADFLKTVAKKFREKGISVSLQLSNTLGHGEYMSCKDCSGLVYDGSPVEKMVGHDGIIAEYAFCWRGKHFRQYINETTAFYVESIKPECVWIDDDLRVSNHAPVNFGCFCDSCMKAFNDENGTNFSREELVDNILFGDIKWRERYVEFLRKGLYDFVYELCSTIHHSCKKTKIGYQYFCNGAYSGYGYSFIFDAMRDATGHLPLSRPGGGAYNDHNPNNFLYKALDINWQNRMLPEYVKVKCPEIENTPHVVYGKSNAGIAFETTYYFVNGNTDMSYSMAMSVNESWDFYEKTFKLFSEHRKYWDRLAKCNIESYQGGLQYYLSKNMWMKKLEKGQDIFDLNKEPTIEMYSYFHTGIPFSYDTDEQQIVLLHPESARFLSNDEIEYLLSKNVITDGETLEILCKKGYDLKLNATRVCEKQAGKLFEQIEKHSSNVEGFKKWRSSFFTPGKKDVYYFLPENEDVEILGKYYNTVPVLPFTNDINNPYGYSTVIFTTKNGGTWAALGYTPWKGIISFSRREQILNIADYISDNGLCARLKTPIQSMLHPRKNKEGKTICVSITNCTVGASGELDLIIRNPKTENFYFMAQRGVESKCNYEKVGKDYLIKVPSLDAWSIGTIFCD